MCALSLERIIYLPYDKSFLYCEDVFHLRSSVFTFHCYGLSIYTLTRTTNSNQTLLLDTFQFTLVFASVFITLFSVGQCTHVSFQIYTATARTGRDYGSIYL